MLINIQTRPKFVKKSELIESLNYFGYNLLGKRLANNVEINLINAPKNSGVWGMIDVEEYSRAPRSFLVSVYRLADRERYIRTLAHEMVHVKQVARRELKIPLLCYDKKYIVTRWHGKILKKKDADYEKHPWEIEADRVGDKLAAKYLKETGLTELSF